MLPGVEVHGSHLAMLRVSQVQVQTLRLANVGTTAYRKINESLLGNFPNCFVNFLNSLWYLADALNASVARND